MMTPALAEERDHDGQLEAVYRARKARAIARVWEQAGGDASMLAETVEAAEFTWSESSIGPDARQARTTLVLLLRTASAYAHRRRVWPEASSQTWAQAIALVDGGA